MEKFTGIHFAKGSGGDTGAHSLSMENVYSMWARLRQHQDELYGWPHDFIESISKQIYENELSEKQISKIAEIYKNFTATQSEQLFVDPLIL